MRDAPVVAVVALAACGASVSAQPARVGDVTLVSFAPEHRRLEPGDTAVSTVVARNVTPVSLAVWIGYSVQDAAGDWHDVEPVRVVIEPRQVVAQRMQWVIPATLGLTSGGYRVVMALWSGRPGADGAVRLANGDRRDAFRVVVHPRASDHAAEPWRAGDHLLGRGRLRPEHVRRTLEGYQLVLPALSCDGAELRAAEYSGFGTSSIRMRTPVAPGSISAFFFYGSVRGADEIDIEIHNDGSRRAMLTAWRSGRKTRGQDVTLPFDPAGAMHDYVIRRTDAELVFAADGVPLARWTSGYPKEPMRLMANAWWPTWLDCVPPSEPRTLDIERIGHVSEAP